LLANDGRFLVVSGQGQETGQAKSSSESIVKVRDNYDHVNIRGLPPKSELARVFASYLRFAEQHKFREPLKKSGFLWDMCPKDTVAVDRLDVKA
jgi:hypothetical protein